MHWHLHTYTDQWLIGNNQVLTMKKILDTLLPLDDVVDEHEDIDLEKWTGRSITHIPVSVRTRDEAKLQVSSLSSLIDDSTCAPRSGGIAGYENIAPLYKSSAENFRRNIAKKRGYIRWLGDGKNRIPVTVVSSATNDGANYQLKRNNQWRNNLGI